MLKKKTKNFTLPKLTGSTYLYIITLGGVIVLRCLFETVSDIDDPQRIIFPADEIFLHYLPWFLVVFMAISIILKHLARFSFTYSFKLVATFSPVILLAPSIDLLVTGGRGLDIGYILPYNWGDFGYYLLTAGGPNWTSSATLGFKLEVAFIVIGIFFLIIYRIRHFGRAIAGCLLSYLVIFTVGMAPFLFVKLSESLLFSRPGYYQTLWSFPDNQLINYQLGIFLFLILLGLIYYMVRSVAPDKFKLILKNARLERATIYVVFMLVGFFLAQMYFGFPQTLLHLILQLFLLVIVIYSAWAQAALINDIADVEIDRMQNTDRALITKQISRKEYLIASIALLIVAIWGSLFINYSVFYLILGYIILLTFLYSLLPLRLKRWPLISNFLTGVVALLCTYAGYALLAPHEEFYLFPAGLAYTILILVTAVSTMKDLKDMPGDYKNKVYTVPNLLCLKLGIRNTYRIIGLIVAASFIVGPLILLPGTLNWPILIFSILFAFLAYWLIGETKVKDTYYLLTTYCFIAVLIILIVVQDLGAYIT